MNKARIKKFIALVFCLTLVDAVNAAPYITANEVFTACSNINQQYCDSYFVGFLHGLMTGADLNIPPSQRALSAQTLKRIFIHDMKKHPEYGDKDAGELIATKLIALKEATIRN